jgi:hypothetical protein
MPDALGTGLGVDVGGALAEDFGGLVSLQTALTCCDALPEEPELPLPPPLPEEQPARARTTMLPIAARGAMERLTGLPAFRGGGGMRQDSIDRADA